MVFAKEKLVQQFQSVWPVDAETEEWIDGLGWVVGTQEQVDKWRKEYER